jgi:hypothetical protein
MFSIKEKAMSLLKAMRRCKKFSSLFLPKAREITIKIKFLPFGRGIQYCSKPSYRFSISFLVEKILHFISNKIINYAFRHLGYACPSSDMHDITNCRVTLFCIVSKAIK